MKIGIILHPYGEKKPSGLGRAAFQIAKSVIEGDTENEYEVILKGTHSEHPHFDGSYSVTEAPAKMFWLDAFLRKRQDFDLVLFLSPSMPFIASPRRSVVVVHDLYHLHGSAQSIRQHLVRFMNKHAIRRASHVVAISRATADDVVALAGASRDKVSVIHYGCTSVCKATPKEVSELHEPYLLAVGVVKERKNVVGIVRGFAAFREKKPSDKHTLLVVGSYKKEDPYYQRIHDEVEKHQLHDRVAFIGFASDAELSYLYRNAAGLIFTTLFEGFGMPVLEAMDCGVPVITSDLAAHREVAGDAALYADPYNPRSIAGAIEQLTTDTELQASLRERGKERARSFTWEKNGREFRELFSRLSA